MYYFGERAFASVIDRTSVATAPVNPYTSADKSKIHQISAGLANRNAGNLVVSAASRPPHCETGGETVQSKLGSVASGLRRWPAFLSAASLWRRAFQSSGSNDHDD